MDEASRQQYLKLMGISAWQSKMPMVDVITDALPAAEPVSESLPELSQRPPLAEKKLQKEASEIPEKNTEPDFIPTDKNLSWDELSAAITECQLCELQQTRKQALVGEGSIQADILFMGDAPDEIDDQEGRLLAGDAGHLFDAMLKAIGLDRQNIYLLNLLKCKLPEGRAAHTSELLCCENFLQQQINLIQPKVIYVMGAAANQLLLNQQSLASMRRRDHHYNNIPVIVSLSPQQLIQNPADKRKAWQDLLQLKKCCR